MEKKKYVILIIIFSLLISCSCSYSRTENEKMNTDKSRDIRRQEPLRQKQSNDKLQKSDKAYIEENINGVSFENDLTMTNSAIKNNVTQMNIGIDQERALQINYATGESPENDVLLEYRTSLPDEIISNIKYNRYNLSYDYFLITSEKEEKMYKNPDPSDAVVCKAYNGEKLALHQKVTGKTIGDSEIWYKVSCKDEGAEKTGYIHSSAGITRTFQFNKMLAEIKKVKGLINQGKLHFISNYKNVNGAPPSKNGAATDEYGIRIYQSAPGYEKADENSEFRYVPDGMLVRILGEQGLLYHVYVISFDIELFIPKKYIDINSYLSEITNIVIVDRSQQNQASFEVNGNNITMVSYTLATTGLKGELSFETPLGYYKAIEKKERFEYLGDNSNEVEGYAPYATRFSGGAYIHGVPVKYEEKDGEKVDPGIKEYLHTIGTFPRSHMCVRNFSSHAEFIYNWMDTERGVIIVIE